MYFLLEALSQILTFCRCLLFVVVEKYSHFVVVYFFVVVDHQNFSLSLSLSWSEGATFTCFTFPNSAWQ